MTTSPVDSLPSANQRLVVCIWAGLLGAAVCIMLGHWRLAGLAGWDVAAVVYVVWVWQTLLPLSPEQVRQHSVREDPGRAKADLILIIASVVSLAAIVLLMAQSQSGALDKAFVVGFGLLSVLISWITIQTTYALKYARLYFGKPEGGVNFSSKSTPQYSDFAYLAFTIGMTFQVSDTELSTKNLRSTALKQALLSYVFGVIIIASTINIIAGLAK